MLVAVYMKRQTEPGPCTSMFSVAMSNTSYPKVSNNKFFFLTIVSGRNRGPTKPPI